MYAYLWYYSLRSNRKGYGRLTDKMAAQLHLVAESCTICRSRSRRPIRKLSDTSFYMHMKSECKTEKIKNMIMLIIREEHKIEVPLHHKVWHATKGSGFESRPRNHVFGTLRHSPQSLQVNSGRLALNSPRQHSLLSLHAHYL